MKLTSLILSNDHSTVARVLTLCGIAWLPLVMLTFFDGTLFGTDVTIPFIKDVAPYVQGLVVIPLLVTADNIIEPMMVRAMLYLKSSGVVPEPEQGRLKDETERMAAMLNSKWIQVILVMLAVNLSWWLDSDYTEMWTQRGVSSWMLHLEDGEVNETLAGAWFLIVTSPLVSFLLYRWLWRFVAWSSFLYRLSRMKLKLYASHNDLAGGLGVVAAGHWLFGMVFFILATIISSELAGNLLYEGEKLVGVKQLVFIFIFCSIVILMIPLMFFQKKLYELKHEALAEYGKLQHQASRDFHQHWIKEEAKDLVDSMQPSAIADYGAVYESVNNMRTIPIDSRGLIFLAITLSIPFWPLLLVESSIWEVLKMLGDSLV